MLVDTHFCNTHTHTTNWRVRVVVAVVVITCRPSMIFISSREQMLIDAIKNNDSHKFQQALANAGTDINLDVKVCVRVCVCVCVCTCACACVRTRWALGTVSRVTCSFVRLWVWVRVCARARVSDEYYCRMTKVRHLCIQLLTMVSCARLTNTALALTGTLSHKTTCYAYTLTRTLRYLTFAHLDWHTTTRTLTLTLAQTDTHTASHRTDTPTHADTHLKTGNVEFVNALLQAGANVNESDNFQRTPLHKVCGQREGGKETLKSRGGGGEKRAERGEGERNAEVERRNGEERKVEGKEKREQSEWQAGKERTRRDVRGADKAINCFFAPFIYSKKNIYFFACRLLTLVMKK